MAFLLVKDSQCGQVWPACIVTLSLNCQSIFDFFHLVGHNTPLADILISIMGVVSRIKQQQQPPHQQQQRRMVSLHQIVAAALTYQRLMAVWLGPPIVAWVWPPIVNVCGSLLDYLTFDQSLLFLTVFFCLLLNAYQLIRNLSNSNKEVLEKALAKNEYRIPIGSLILSWILCATIKRMNLNSRIWAWPGIPIRQCWRAAYSMLTMGIVVVGRHVGPFSIVRYSHCPLLLNQNSFTRWLQDPLQILDPTTLPSCRRYASPSWTATAGQILTALLVSVLSTPEDPLIVVGVAMGPLLLSLAAHERRRQGQKNRLVFPWLLQTTAIAGLVPWLDENTRVLDILQTFLWSGALGFYLYGLEEVLWMVLLRPKDLNTIVGHRVGSLESRQDELKVMCASLIGSHNVEAVYNKASSISEANHQRILAGKIVPLFLLPGPAPEAVLEEDVLRMVILQQMAASSSIGDAKSKTIWLRTLSVYIQAVGLALLQCHQSNLRQQQPQIRRNDWVIPPGLVESVHLAIQAMGKQLSVAQVESAFYLYCGLSHFDPDAAHTVAQFVHQAGRPKENDLYVSDEVARWLKSVVDANDLI